MLIGESYYPELLKKYYILNPPKILPILYNMLSRFVDPKTLAKVVILPKDKDIAFKILADAIGEENIPAVFGGECECEGGCLPPGGPFSDTRDNGTTVNPVTVSVSRRGTLLRLQTHILTLHPHKHSTYTRQHNMQQTCPPHNTRFNAYPLHTQDNTTCNIHHTNTIDHTTRASPYH